MNILRYDPEVDALYLDISEAPVMNTEEIAPGIMLDYDKDGQVIGVEILDILSRLEVQKAPSVKMAAMSDVDVKVVPRPGTIRDQVLE